MTTALSSSDWKRLRGGLPAASPRSKYGNKKVKGFDKSGAVITFDSVKEAKRWGELLLLEKQGIISQLERQIPFHFAIAGKYLLYSSNRKAKYVLDFAYFHKQLGEKVYEDVKGGRGTVTDVYRLKKALMKLFFDIEVREV